VIHEEKSLFWRGDSIGHYEKKVRTNICQILNGYQDRAVWIYRPNSVRFLLVGLDEKLSLQKKGGYIRQIAHLHWMLLPALRSVKINTDEEHAIFAHEFRNELRLTVGFSNMYCELQQTRHFCVINLSFQHWIKIEIILKVSWCVRVCSEYSTTR